MKEVTINKHKCKIYDSIEDLPIVRFHHYNHMVLVDAGIGSEISDFDNHIERVVRYIKNKDNDNAAKELDNLRQNVYQIMSKQSIKDLSFAVLVAEIDGKPCNDMSQDGLQKVVELLSGATKKELTDISQSVKKKIDDEQVLYFPKQFNDVSTREYYDLLKRHTLANIRLITDGESEENKKEVEKLEEKIVLFVKPKVYTGHDGVEVTHDKNFETMCLAITKETGKDAKSMSVLEYYNAYEYIQEMARKTQNKAR